MKHSFMIVIYTCFAWQFYYIMNLQFMIVIYTHFVRQSYYIMNRRKKRVALDKRLQKIEKRSKRGRLAKECD